MIGELGSEESAPLQAFATHPQAGTFPNVLRELLATYEEMGKSVVPELPLELALVKLLV